MLHNVLRAFVRRPDHVYAVRILGPTDLAPFMSPQTNVVGCWVPGSKDVNWLVRTAHGEVNAAWGDWLVTDGKGDWWPVKDGIFRERYMEVEFRVA